MCSGLNLITGSRLAAVFAFLDFLFCFYLATFSTWATPSAGFTNLTKLLQIDFQCWHNPYGYIVSKTGSKSKVELFKSFFILKWRVSYRGVHNYEFTVCPGWFWPSRFLTWMKYTFLEPSWHEKSCGIFIFFQSCSYQIH